MNAPVPAAPPELAEAEQWAREFVSAEGWYRQNTHIALLLAEYDRRRASLAAVRAAVASARERAEEHDTAAFRGQEGYGYAEGMSAVVRAVEDALDGEATT